MTDGEYRRSGPRTAVSYALLLVLVVEVAVWGSFLVPLRAFGVPVPAGPLVVLVGNAAFGIAGTRLLGRRLGGVPPFLLWLALALTFGSRRPEGDVVIPGGLMGTAYLLLGTLSSVTVLGIGPSLRRPDSR